MRAISAVAIPSTLNLSLPKPHTTYQIQVTLVGSLQSYQVSRRYSQFVELERQIVDSTGIRPPCALPPKTLFGRSDIAQRREALETYLRALVAHVTLSTCPPLLHFLDVPNATASSAQTASELKGEEYYNLLRDAKTALQRAKQALATASTSTSPADRANLQQALHVAQGALQRVDRAMQTQHGDVSDAEVLRRRDALDAFYRDLAALVASGGQLRSVASAPSGGGAILTSPFAPSTRPSGGAGGGGRRLGQPKETERTIGQSNIELLQSQTQIMSDQDTQLASLLPLLQRQRELGQVIGRELDEQNAALDELAGATDGVAAKIARGKKQITKVTGK